MFESRTCPYVRLRAAYFNRSIEWLSRSGRGPTPAFPDVLRLRILILLVLALSAPVHAADKALARIAVGAPPPAEVKELLDQVLETSAKAGSIDREDEERLLRLLREDTIDVLSTEGFFSPKITITIDETNEARYVMRLDLGRRTQVGDVEIKFTGAIVERPERIASLRDGWTLARGRPFRDAEWSSAKTKLLNRVRTRDFAAARLADSTAEINADTATATLRVEIDSGPAYTMGEVRVKGLTRFDAELVQRYNPIAVGEAYDADKLLDFQQRLQRSPYFGTVLVDANPENATDGKLPILVEVREAKTKRVSFGLGYSTDTAIRGETAYRQTLLFGYPYTLQSGIGLDKTRGVAYADIFLPPKPDGEQDSFGGLYEHTDIEGVKTDRWALGVQRTYKRVSGPVSYDTRLALNFQHETREVADAPEEDTTNDVVSATYSWTRRDVDSITNPTRGAILTLAGTVGVRRTGVSELLNQTFERVYGRYVLYWPLTPRDQLILRSELGHVFVDDARIVPNEFLFRTGGVGTVRGYAFQSLGRKVGTATTGSTSLVVGSVEYVRWLTQEWGSAVFYDIGNASDDIKEVSLAQGFGVGVRYRTVAGPIALDVAYGERTQRLRFHFSIAIAF